MTGSAAAVDSAASVVSHVMADFEAAGSNPVTLFQSWLTLAHQSEINDANAMSLATVDADGLPNVRLVLLKDFDERGFVFYTNSTSKKGGELQATGKAAGVLHWKSLRRQVRFRGEIAVVADDEADAYFASRSRESRIGAWASQQSQPIAARSVLLDAVTTQTERFGEGLVPRPPHWKGFRIVPQTIEFWMDRPARLHDRIILKSADQAGSWTPQILFP